MEGKKEKINEKLFVYVDEKIRHLLTISKNKLMAADHGFGVMET